MKLVVRDLGNDKFRFPQELEDIIFLYSDTSTHKETITLQSNYVKKYTEYSSLETAAEKGNLQCIKVILSCRDIQCAKNAMDRAAENGHLEVVKWLHKNRNEGCTDDAMDMAAENGYLEVVKWLHYNRNEGCSYGQ
jgi:hypothetical protein